MSRANGRDLNDDYVGKGFHRLDKNLLTIMPPKIKWGAKYRAWPDERKIEYLEKLAATMNHAARVIQDERDQLLELCGKKEDQIVSMKRNLDENNSMIQQQITQMNEDKQNYNAAAAKMKAEIRRLEHDDNS